MEKIASHIPFDIKSIKVNTEIPFNIYIKNRDAHELILKKGSRLSRVALLKLQAHKNFFISKREQKESLHSINCDTFREYLQLNIYTNEMIITSLYKISETIFSNLLLKSYNEQTNNCLNTLIKDIIELLYTKKDYLKQTIESLRDDYELNIHSFNVAFYAINLGRLLKFNEEELLALGVAGILHDIGIHNIDDAILYKNSQLNTQELKIVQEHPILSLKKIELLHIHNPSILEAVKHHHERYDGSGYPDHLTKSQISKSAAILAICDVFDALTSERPYRKKLSSFEALKLMLKDPEMSRKFNREYLKIFLKSLV